VVRGEMVLGDGVAGEGGDAVGLVEGGRGVEVGEAVAADDIRLLSVLVLLIIRL